MERTGAPTSLGGPDPENLGSQDSTGAGGLLAGAQRGALSPLSLLLGSSTSPQPRRLLWRKSHLRVNQRRAGLSRSERY